MKHVESTERLRRQRSLDTQEIGNNIQICGIVWLGEELLGLNAGESEREKSQ